MEGINYALDDLNNDKYVVIDLDTGTILGTNLMVVALSAVPENLRDILTGERDASDSEIADLGLEYGNHLWVG